MAGNLNLCKISRNKFTFYNFALVADVGAISLFRIRLSYLQIAQIDLPLTSQSEML